MVKTKKRVRKKERVSIEPWFRRISEAKGVSTQWGWIPLNWKGGVALFVLIAINVFAAQYFNLLNVGFDGISKFLIVFFLSVFVFIMIARRKTRSVKNDK